MANILDAVKLSEADIIRAILNSYFIVDYGYINKVNPDKTVNVTHAAKPVLINGTELPETTTDNVEVLTISGAGFSVQWDYKAKDKVLLLGLKDYVPSVDSVEQAEVPKAFIHYTRTNLKAIPLCLFNDEAKVNIVIEEGKLTLNTEDAVDIEAGKTLTVKANDGKMTIEATDEIDIKSDKAVKVNAGADVEVAAGSGKKIKLNGDSKQLVTWTELNTALTNFLTQLTIAMTTTPIVGNGSPQPTWSGLPTSIDISAAKTQTVVTGG